MLSTVQSYQLNGRTVPIDLARVPTFSSEPEGVLRGLNANLPGSFQTIQPLQDVIVSLKEAMKELQEIKDHGKKNKMIAILKSAVLVSLIASVILCGVYGALPGFCAALALTALLCVLSYRWDGRAKKMGPYYVLFLVPVVGILWDAFTQEANVAKIVNKRQTYIAKEMALLKKQNDRILLGAYPFYTGQSAQLLHQLNGRVQQIQGNLAQMQQFTQRSPAGEAELSQRLTAHLLATEELNAVSAFYRQFDPT